MRRTTAGLLSLALASGLGVTFSSQAAFAAPPGRHRTGCGGSQELGSGRAPNPAEEKRRALRSEAITQILNGEVTPQQINGSTVVKLKGAKDSTPAAGPPRPEGRQGRQTKDQYVELKREKTDKIFVILAEFGNERHPNYPDQDTDPATPGPTRFDGPLHNQIPAARPRGGQLDRLAARLQRRLLPAAVLRHRPRRRVAEDRTTRRSPRVATASTARSPTGSRCGTTRPATAAATAYPCAPATSAPTPGPWSATRRTWVADQKAAGRTDAPDHGRARVVRPVGPLRLRRRRQLQRAGRLHRPLPDRPLRRRPGRR